MFDRTITKNSGDRKMENVKITVKTKYIGIFVDTLEDNTYCLYDITGNERYFINFPSNEIIDEFRNENYRFY